MQHKYFSDFYHLRMNQWTYLDSYIQSIKCMKTLFCAYGKLSIYLKKIKLLDMILNISSISSVGPHFWNKNSKFYLKKVKTKMWRRLVSRHSQCRLLIRVDWSIWSFWYFKDVLTGRHTAFNLTKSNLKWQRGLIHTMDSLDHKLMISILNSDC